MNQGSSLPPSPESPSTTNPWLRLHRRRALRRATTRAYRLFARQHPGWRGALFDEFFLAHRGAPVLASHLEGLAPDPAALAGAWADQWGWRPASRAVFVARITPVAARFLALLELELRSAGAARSSHRTATES